LPAPIATVKQLAERSHSYTPSCGAISQLENNFYVYAS